MHRKRPRIYGSFFGVCDLDESVRISRYTTDGYQHVQNQRRDIWRQVLQFVMPKLPMNRSTAACCPIVALIDRGEGC